MPAAHRSTVALNRPCQTAEVLFGDRHGLIFHARWGTAQKEGNEAIARNLLSLPHRSTVIIEIANRNNQSHGTRSIEHLSAVRISVVTFAQHLGLPQ